MNKTIFLKGIKIELVKEIDEIKDLWNRCVDSNNDFSVFQTFEWNKTVCKTLSFKLGVKSRFIVIDSKLIIPLEINTKTKSIHILGYSRNSDFLSFIYSELDFDTYKFSIDAIKHVYPEYVIHLNRIHEDSAMVKYIKKNDFFKEQMTNCVRINVDFQEDFLEKLSKNTKQNIRTAKNRIAKNNKHYKVNIKNQVFDKRKSIELLVMYRKRLLEKNSFIFLKRVKIKLITFFIRTFGFDHFDVLSLYSKSNEVYVSEIVIDEKLVAYFQGIQHKGVMYVLRAATNEHYRYYSPGQILLLDSINSLDKRIKVFDLTRGDEDYKIRFGGEIYKSYSFIL